MDFTRAQRRLAQKFRRSNRLHRARIPSQQRLHLAALLILLATSSQAADGINLDPTITQEEFHTFTAMAAQVIFPTPVNPADPGGLLGFDLGVAATAIPIDENADWWVNSVDRDLIREGYLVVPRIVVSKGIGIGNLSASYAAVPDTDAKILGGALDVPIIRGGVVWPTLVLRGSYAELQGIDEFELTTYGAEAVLGKAFGPITPYIGGGVAWVESQGHIEASAPFPAIELRDEFEQPRYTGGLRISLFLLKIVAEVTRAEETTYSAKVSLGL